MSETKRLQRYSRDFNGNLSKDPNGDWVLFGDAAEREGILTGKIGAQRLRADTAEAELAECKRKHLRSCQIAIGKSQLAKERHSQLIEAEEIRASWQNGYDVKCQNVLLLTVDNRALRGLLRDAEAYLPNHGEGSVTQHLHRRIQMALMSGAALNPNPEAESHE